MNFNARTGFAAGMLLIAALAFGTSAWGDDDWAVPRRKDPFPAGESYLALLLPYSIPGIGSGVGFVFYETNHWFPHRAYVVALTGDVQGTFTSIEQIPLINKRLLVDLFAANLGTVQFRNYTFRGMGTDGNRYTLLEYDRYNYYAPQLTLTEPNRRFDVYFQPSQSETRLTRVRDSSGHVISDFTDPPGIFARQYRAGLRLDLTDEYYDPRKGTRFVVEYNDSPRQSSIQPDFYTLDYRLSGYVPIGKRSTLALHSFQSDAIVRQTGETRAAALAQIDNLGCQPGDATCQASQTALINNDMAAHKNGTSTTLGGDTYLRGYPANRFQGAHTLYVSAELRINLTEEATPFDYFFFRDVRTGFQIAPFYEAGSVSETPGTLGDRWKDDGGVGIRLITASGSVYRADFAVGSEGFVPTLTVFYPW